ncbi:hypothetical protein C8Q72DRAFT_49717 [Fomitopsis betulina]|nr:hypothetical protein C8Q72DRAFT_49717 [Fomitopsis betulina]
MDSDSPETGLSVEHDRAAPLPASSTLPYGLPVDSDESESLLSAAPSPGSKERTGILARLTGALPSAALLRCIINHPAFNWHRLGCVRENTDVSANAPTSRFAGCWANFKKRQPRLQWWHYLLILFVLSTTIPHIVFAAVQHVRRPSWKPGQRPEHICFHPTAESMLRLGEPRPHVGRQDSRYKATTSFGVRANIPQFTLNAQDSHGVVRFVLDNSTEVRRSTTGNDELSWFTE